MMKVKLLLILLSSILLSGCAQKDIVVSPPTLQLLPETKPVLIKVAKKVDKYCITNIKETKAILKELRYKTSFYEAQIKAYNMLFGRDNNE